jgi:hypothetical protein
MTAAAAIKASLAKHGATICLPRSAAVLGETTPGWRRNAERRAEVTHSKTRRARLQTELEARHQGSPPEVRGRRHRQDP